MKSKNDDNKIFDSIRNTYVVKTPEEIVRQKLIYKLVNELNFPKNLISIEKDLLCLPYLKNKNLNLLKRRADIICFAKNIHPRYSLYPLLMIECKADKFTKDVIDQVLGYNFYVKSYFVAIANKLETKTFWYDQKNSEYKSVNFIPKFENLIREVNV
ncbi:MAG: type I restriction enzyme HsdR N-terminal domain-containing protein [Parachlamydiales bacterium]|nr:type I restriction enzyme HsdR N-terminal domain-containing protein [Parachlamydiales bacterium]